MYNPPGIPLPLPVMLCCLSIKIKTISMCKAHLDADWITVDADCEMGYIWLTVEAD